VLAVARGGLDALDPGHHPAQPGAVPQITPVRRDPPPQIR
jgi:hypothetical protein